MALQFKSKSGNAFHHRNRRSNVARAIAHVHILWLFSELISKNNFILFVAPGVERDSRNT